MSHTITFRPSGVRIRCRPDQTIAEAALEQGVVVPVSCENGVCQICQAPRLSGDFRFRNELGEAILEQDNQVLCCVAYPSSDAEIDMPDVFAPYHKAEVSLACQVRSVTELPGNVYRAELLAPAGKKVDFWPGQYLMLTVDTRDGEQQLPYSLASAPGSMTGADPRTFELHIAAGSDTADQVIAYLKQAIIARVTLPFGDCRIHPDYVKQHKQTPLLMVAAGSGFSQIKSLIEGVLALNPLQEIHLYWSNKNRDGFYLADLPLSWAQTFANFHYHPIIEQHSDGWNGRAGWIYQVIHEDFTDLSQAQMFACGSPNMVYGTLDQLQPLGLSQSNMHSDVFAYAPR
ncbi:2Fe-2S iron-sulfur cluster-binding protein [Thalassolituus sp. LLYu03]|uniref:2Fe-2S iron-sulfur cluster-binding protein n=1 Tax=Thalassolituus sp. LLYu03 TaxID=3421656 RepID=UPI003D2CC3FB